MKHQERTLVVKVKHDLFVKIGAKREQAWNLLINGMTISEFYEATKDEGLNGPDLLKTAIEQGAVRLVEVPEEAVKFRKVSLPPRPRGLRLVS